MKDKLLNILAKVLAYQPIRDRIIEKAKNRPYTHIGDYMERYWIIEEDSALAKLLGVSIRLHIIKRPDQDRALHTHPFTFRTFILEGGYTELRDLEVLLTPLYSMSNSYHRVSGTTYKLDRTTPHAIVSLDNNEPAVSLFVYGQRKGDWYFDTDEGLIPHAKYLNEQEKQNV